MNQSDLFLIGDIPSFTPQIGRLVSMMNYVRHNTPSEVGGLWVKQLDYLHDPKSNSIGALLLHITAAEVWFQAETFLGRELGAEEMREWGAALDLGEEARREIRDHNLDYYVSRMGEVRAKTLAEFGRCEDKWLEERTPWEGGGRTITSNGFTSWRMNSVTQGKSGG